MADLKTTYMGLALKNPIIVGSSELSNSVEKIVNLAKAGAGAVIVKSLFEEQINMDIDAQRMNNSAGTYDHYENYMGFYLKKHNVDNYLKLIKDAKSSIDIPLLASINCVSDTQWIEFAKKIEDAGADALEINLFVMPANEENTSEELENMYLSLANKLTELVHIPVSLKLSTYFSGMANFFIKLSKTNIKSLVLFNKFYNPAIDIEQEKLVSHSIYSKAEDNGPSLRWIGILDGKVNCELAASTGVHGANEVIGNLLVGAQAVQMVSAIYQHGNGHIQKTLTEVEQWMDKKGYGSIADFRGKLSQKSIKNPMLFERAQFMKYFADAGR